jgi:hypothetical protein
MNYEVKPDNLILPQLRGHHSLTRTGSWWTWPFLARCTGGGGGPARPRRLLEATGTMPHEFFFT